MKRLVFATLLAASPLLAQPSAKPDEAAKPVAVVDGQAITAGQLDDMYNRLRPDMRAQYDRNGGKPAFLDNYIEKMLVLKAAQKAGFDKRPDVQADLQAARDSALFDRYIRETVGSKIVTEGAMKEYYQNNIRQFAVPEMVHLRQIVISTDPRSKMPHSDEEAMQIAKKAVSDVLLTIPRNENPLDHLKENAKKFAALARAYSEDGAAQNGGDLGWIKKGTLDPDFETPAFAARTGIPTGIIHTRYGYHIFFVEAKQAAGAMSYDEARPQIRETLLGMHTQEVIAAVKKMTDDLSDKSKIQMFPENIQ